MFNSKAKYINNCFSLIKKVGTTLIAITTAILWLLNVFLHQTVKIIPQNLYMGVNTPLMNFLTNTLFFGIINTLWGFILLISSMFVKKKCIKVFVKECKEIIDSTTLPKKLPKVVYIYTCHNDLIQARVLQNSKQTYKNFEVWVSDGSDDPEWREKIKKFCGENNINLFQLGPEGSSNKADNLNQFLKWYKGDYEYILVGDADEVFHKNFVEYAIKMFYSDKIKNLCYVTPVNVNYRSKGIYSNTTRIIETNAYYWSTISRNFSLTHLPPISGQSCLISRKSLIECNGAERFDSGNLEDWYLEAGMVEKLNYGIMLPNTPCYFEPDVNVKAHFNRIMRVDDWTIRWWKIRKKEILINYTSKYSAWYKIFFIKLFVPLLIYASLGFLCFVIWLFCNFWNEAFKDNLLFWIFVGVILFFGLVTLIINSILIGKINFNIFDQLWFPLIFIMWVFVANIKVTIHWFKSLFLGKYSQFGGSGNSRFSKAKNDIFKWWIGFVILSICLIAFNVPMFLIGPWHDFRWLIIIFNIYVGVFWLGTLSYLGLWYINKIPYNASFSREKEIECKELF